MAVARILSICGVLLLSPVWGSNGSDGEANFISPAVSSSNQSLTDEEADFFAEKLKADTTSVGRLTLRKTLADR